jgi:hypothetical protein
MSAQLVGCFNGDAPPVTLQVVGKRSIEQVGRQADPREPAPACPSRPERWPGLTFQGRGATSMLSAWVGIEYGDGPNEDIKVESQ